MVIGPNSVPPSFEPNTITGKRKCGVSPGHYLWCVILLSDFAIAQSLGALMFWAMCAFGWLLRPITEAMLDNTGSNPAEALNKINNFQLSAPATLLRRH